ncbi:MAG: VWA domain-containing protein, partial [Spirochaetota bacterium]|nr:VWA domain-containing protein [Spirochaetota bacterium]
NGRKVRVKAKIYKRLKRAAKAKRGKAKRARINDKAANDSPYNQTNREKYEDYGENPRLSPLTEPFSTFSVDVDTGSYTNTRRYLTRMNTLPPKSAVRVEEFINYFDYQYPLPKGKRPFSIYHEMAPSPFDKGRHLLHIGLQGYKVPASQRPASNLVFLIDVSGSMQSEHKLELLKKAMIMLTEQMKPQDKISLVVYAGAAGVVLEPTSGKDKSVIESAINRLTAGGSTAGAAGIELAYKMAARGFIRAGINRVILATDGDFNVGISDHQKLIKLIENKRKSGIALTVMGFGMYNLNDRTMEQLANKGNGNYFYIDNLNEARKVLVTELAATLQIIAKDVKIQVEFNPKYVSSYRLIGYENRRLTKEQFRDDRVDAGEIGAGHTVTAIYEITLTRSEKGSSSRYKREKPKLKQKSNQSKTRFRGEIAFFKLRYKAPRGDQSILVKKALKKSHILKRKASNRFLYSAAVAFFAQKLKNSRYAEHVTYDDILKVMSSSVGGDHFGYREECKDLLIRAKAISRMKS